MSPTLPNIPSFNSCLWNAVQGKTVRVRRTTRCILEYLGRFTSYEKSHAILFLAYVIQYIREQVSLIQILPVTDKRK